MGRITITIADERYRALKEAAASRGKSIRELIDESLEFYGIKTREQAEDLVRGACLRSRMTLEQAQQIANEEVRRQRDK
ncbi:MAG: hypothetical protein RJQ08_05855 [Salinisphaeraceae bacterium]